MTVSPSERRRKLRIVSEYLGFLSAEDLLCHFRGKSIVPGICTDRLCDCIISVECDEGADLCPECETYTMQSILIFSGVH
jgi:hypothetical protein